MSTQTEPRIGWGRWVGRVDHGGWGPEPASSCRQVVVGEAVTGVHTTYGDFEDIGAHRFDSFTVSIHAYPEPVQLTCGYVTLQHEPVPAWVRLGDQAPDLRDERGYYHLRASQNPHTAYFVRVFVPDEEGARP